MNVDEIMRLVNDCMERGDCYVSVYNQPDGTTSVSVYPNDDERPHWEVTSPGLYNCSECGCESDWTSLYCPRCGERLYYELGDYE